MEQRVDQEGNKMWSVKKNDQIRLKRKKEKESLVTFIVFVPLLQAGRSLKVTGFPDDFYITILFLW